jgi:hypothetical protein
LEAKLEGEDLFVLPPAAGYGKSREFKRGEAPLYKTFPFPLVKGRGIKGDGVENPPLR